YIRRHPWGTGPGVTTLLTEGTFTEQGHHKPDLPPYVINEPFILQHDFYYFDVGVELGAIALVVFLILLFGGIGLGLRTRRAARGDPALTALGTLAVGTAVLALVHNLTNESFRSPQVASYVWFVLAAAIAFGRPRPAPPGTEVPGTEGAAAARASAGPRPLVPEADPQRA
ncbi:MAG: hypothetical protein ACYDAD_05320, partial [Acidimicrobiales bacterium]